MRRRRGEGGEDKENKKEEGEIKGAKIRGVRDGRGE